MKELIQNQGKLNIVITPEEDFKWWSHYPTWTVRDLLLRSGYDYEFKNYESFIIVSEIEKVRGGIYVRGNSLNTNYPFVWSENVIIMQHFLENNRTFDRYYITNNFNSNVQLIIEIVLNDIFKKEKERFLLNVLKKLKEKE